MNTNTTCKSGDVVLIDEVHFLYVERLLRNVIVHNSLNDIPIKLEDDVKLIINILHEIKKMCLPEFIGIKNIEIFTETPLVYKVIMLKKMIL